MLFDKTKDGKEVHLYELSNANVTVGLIDLSAAIAYVKCPDVNGKIDNVVLFYNNASELLSSKCYFGLTIGRYANRISGGRFSIGDKSYQLSLNDGPNHLHGGDQGMSFALWDAQYLTIDSNPAIKFTYDEKDGTENYPGNLHAETTYILKEDGSLVINYLVTCDQSCPINLCNHSYFNLTGDFSKTIKDHELRLACSRYLPVDETLIPTGELKDVKGTGFDFREMKAIGKDFDEVGGYDHCFVVDKGSNEELKQVAYVVDPISKRTLTVSSTKPAIQFYSGNFLHNEPYYKDHTGFALETELYPDSPNHPEFPNCILAKGEVYNNTTIYKFGVQE